VGDGDHLPRRFLVGLERQTAERAGEAQQQNNVRSRFPVSVSRQRRTISLTIPLREGVGV
jgi:hypothetical protein